MDWSLFWTILAQVGIAALPLAVILYVVLGLASAGIATGLKALVEARATRVTSTHVYSTETDE